MASFKSLSTNSGNSIKQWLKRTVCPGPFNKAQQFAADGRRTPFPWLLRRHSKVAAVLGVSPMRVPTLILLVLLIIGCDSDSGGGIAGASWDSKKSLVEIENYQGYIAPTVAEEIVKNQCSGRSKETWAGISQHFE